jgi:hypothetical protein
MATDDRPRHAAMCRTRQEIATYIRTVRSTLAHADPVVRGHRRTVPAGDHAAARTAPIAFSERSSALLSAALGALNAAAAEAHRGEPVTAP